MIRNPRTDYISIYQCAPNIVSKHAISETNHAEFIVAAVTFDHALVNCRVIEV